jgi:anti-sigma B factor antagonist
MSHESAQPRKPWLTMQTQQGPGEVVIQCSGWMTVEHTRELREHVRTLLPDAKKLVLDLKEVTRMDSAGLGTLVGVYISARKAGCDFQVINYNQSVKNLFGMTNLLTVFESCAKGGMRIP